MGYIFDNKSQILSSSDAMRLINIFFLRYSQSFSPNLTIVCKKSVIEPKWSSGDYGNVKSLLHPYGIGILYLYSGSAPL